MARQSRVKRKDPWLHGYAAALGNVIRQHKERQLVEHCMTGDGITVKMLEDAGVDPYDLNVIREAFERRQPLKA